MLFNSIEFALFFPIVFFLHWFIARKNKTAQNTILLIASYFFYGWWDWRFLVLLSFSSTVDFLIGLGLLNQDNNRIRKLLLCTSLIVNIGLLVSFKYFNFFIENFSEAFTFLGNPISSSSLNIILPVGISFYTFQSLSYSIDVYRKKIEPTKDTIAFFLFVSFFPQLVAGPIEKAKNLLPQFYRIRYFSYPSAVDGMRQILAGLFKKMVIADQCAVFVDKIFANYSIYSGSTLFFGAILFTIQIYMDFSGYSDIAIGTARILGIQLTQNFNTPYFSKSISEFWTRWHISLSNWFKDYVYIPLGGNRISLIHTIRNVFIVFLLSGFWHGANWTFLLWGALHACFMVPAILIKHYQKQWKLISKFSGNRPFKVCTSTIGTFILVTLTFIVFRSQSISFAKDYISNIFNISFFTLPQLVHKKLFLLICIYFLVEYYQKNYQHIFHIEKRFIPKVFRWTGYVVLIISILSVSETQKSFIYFQF